MLDEHESFSNTGVPHLLVDMISANNARYCYKQSSSGGHFLYQAFLRMAAENAQILQEGSNFHKKTAKKIIMPPIFQKVRFEMQIKFTNLKNIYGIMPCTNVLWLRLSVLLQLSCLL